jgi:excinuclease ABC subunit A
LKITGAWANNLQNIDVEIPSGVMTVITGVSGSGKTSLLDRVIFESYTSARALYCESIRGFENFDHLIYIEQPLPGKGYTATAGSMLGISEVIAAIFAGLNESKTLGFKTSHFTAGSRDGRCPACEGTGVNRVSMDFINDVSSPCERCGGTGFRDEILEIRIDGTTVYDALQIPFGELSGFFDAHLKGKSKQPAASILELVRKTGLGHLAGGRPLKTVSTGELQRLKLVSGLSEHTGSHTLILLDEPTGGLHPGDTGKLLILFNELTEAGNTLVCVTHEPILTGAAARIIELGPGGGTRGGRIVSNRENS